MEYLYIILFIASIVITIISLVAHTSNSNEMKKEHNNILSQLTPARSLAYMEKEAFEKLYKKKLTGDIPVYSITGPVEYISITVNHAETKTYAIGGILIALRSVAKLAKKRIGISLDAEAQKLDQLKNINESQITEDFLKQFNNEIEFVFLPKDNKRKKAYIVKFNEWKIESYLAIAKK